MSFLIHLCSFQASLKPQGILYLDPPLLPDGLSWPVRDNNNCHPLQKKKGSEPGTVTVIFNDLM